MDLNGNQLPRNCSLLRELRMIDERIVSALKNVVDDDYSEGLENACQMKRVPLLKQQTKQTGDSDS